MVFDLKNVLIATSFVAPMLISGAVSGGQFRDKMVETFRMEDVDRIVAEINEAKRKIYDQDTINFFSSYWDGSLKYKLRADISSNHLIRINVADFLVQSAMNGFADMDLTPFREYAVKRLEDENEQVVSSALLVIGRINNDSDVPILKQHVYTESNYIFRSAILALIFMCSDRASDAINEISVDANDDRRMFISQTKTRFDDGHHCKR